MISAAGLPGDVTALVHVAAYAPDEGENVLGFSERFPKTAGAEAIRADDGFLTLEPSLYPKVIVGDVPERDGRILSAVQKPTSEKCFGEPAGLPAWRSLPTWYVRSASDRMLHPDAQAWFVGRLGGDSVSIDSSHGSPVSHPQEVADAILEAAKHRAEYG